MSQAGGGSFYSSGATPHSEMKRSGIEQRRMLQEGAEVEMKRSGIEQRRMLQEGAEVEMKRSEIEQRRMPQSICW